jgi:hypothetical protein
MAKGDMLAKQFEAKAQEATAVIEKLSDADWTKVTSGEKWPICVVAHHVAQSHLGIAGLIKSVASGAHNPSMTMDDIHKGNAKHAQDFSGVSKAETLALHKKNAEAAAAIVRGLDDASLARSASALSGMPAMSAEQLAAGLLCGHVDEHIGSIKKTVGA